MIDPILEWDSAKAYVNLRKHGVPFVLAGLVFRDRDRVEKEEPKHSVVEKRYLAVGSVGGAVLAVAFTRRGKAIRIISARPASRKERRQYHTGAP